MTWKVILWIVYVIVSQMNEKKPLSLEIQRRIERVFSTRHYLTSDGDVDQTNEHRI